MKFFKIATAALSTAILFLTSTALADITLVEQGKSDYSIIVPANAPHLLKEAAQELQKDIALATGATLPIVQDSEKTQKHFISLGATSQTISVGFSSKDMPVEGYRIITQSGNLYIFGPDTPDGERTDAGGVSNGSANGVYVFLEKYLGVRWLMPGDIGRDVPRQKTWTLKEIDQAGAPRFNYRYLSHTLEYMTPAQFAEAIRWLHHMRVGAAGTGDKIAFRGSVSLAYDHNLWRTINRSDPSQRERGSNVHTAAVRELHKKHPDWFAMNAKGRRPLPTRHYDKMETTNPGLVQWFAEQAIKSLKSSARPSMYSLSLSDGRDWSQSPQSKEWYDPIPKRVYDAEAGTGRPSMTSLVLKWYHDIAKIVAEKDPQVRLGGYIYGDYLFPPVKYQMKLPDNFTPVLAYSPSYGFGQYDKSTRDEFRYVMDAWAKVAPTNWYYYDLPNQLFRQEIGGVSSAPVGFPGSTAIVMPAAPEILNTLFSTLVKDHIAGTVLYGISSWSSSAMSNYLLAAMEWDPTLNANDVQREWLERAYGVKAAKVMETFYHDLDVRFADYYRKHPKMRIYVTLDMLRDLYAKHYPAMEKTYLQAEAQPMTTIQKQRLRLIGDNLIVLQWRLRNIGFLPANFDSKLKRSNEQAIALISRPNADFPLFPGAIQANPSSGFQSPVAFDGEVRRIDADSAKLITHPFPSTLREGMVVLLPSVDGIIRIETELATQSAYFATYSIQDKTGRSVARGILNKGTPVIFQAKANEPYYLYVVPRKGVHYRLRIANATAAAIGYDSKKKILTLAATPAAVAVGQIPGARVGISEQNGAVEIIRPFSGTGYVSRMMQTGLYSQARVLASLTDGWAFQPDPDNKLAAKDVTKSGFDDSHWKKISALNWWQLEGFSDYHGPAWYRIEFTIPSLKSNEQTRVYFGSVDGNAEVYLNGHKVTEHKVGPPPSYKGWNSWFSSHIPHNWWKPGHNVLAVKVTSKSAATASGITGGVAIVGRIPKAK